MFKNKKFVFIGRLGKEKKKEGCSRNDLRTKIIKEGGSVSPGISGKTDYVILPENATERSNEMNNKQIKKINRKNINNTKFLKVSWLENSLKNNKIEDFKNYEVNLFKNKTIINQKDFFVLNSFEENPPYDNIISDEMKFYMEIPDHESKTQPFFYYNALNGSSSYYPIKNFRPRLFGKKSIIDEDYYSDDSILERNNDVKRNLEKIKNDLNFLTDYNDFIEKK